MSAPTITVIVPSYRRPTDLERCLSALAKQSRAPQHVLVVARSDDALTWSVARSAPSTLPVAIVPVFEAGVVAALNAGLARASSDIVAFTDDDAAPRSDWLARIAAHFAADRSLGGIGGRDWIFQHGKLEDGRASVVGRLYWFGRCVGRHHLGTGAPREVDVLKGVNMAFRAAALEGIRFDDRLRGGGAQVGNELGVSLAVKRRGWKLLYDPDVAVDHYPARRHDEDQRNTFSTLAIRNAVFNETLLLCCHFGPIRRLVFMSWALAVGDRAAPGLTQWLRLARGDWRRASARLATTLVARIEGFREALR